MIRNRTFIYAALVVAMLFVIKRRQAFFSGIIPPFIWDHLPSEHLLLFVIAVSALLAMISPTFFKVGSRHRVRSRKEFKPDPFPVIQTHIDSMTRESKPNVPLILDYIFFQAIESHASDIHLDPTRHGFNIHFRIDGIMTRIAALPATVRTAISNRLKVLSNLVVYQGYLPQDGRIGALENDPAQNGAQFRIAFMPTLHGERIVIRILGQHSDSMSFADLGMSDAQQQAMLRYISKPQGTIILTGPTGSGKTTTIYAALRAIREETGTRRAIATLEDPIEREIEGVNQSQVNEEKSFTFEIGLRALLRQDPDVIMVGEIRDIETARIAIQAGMTGHLIISTVHANSSAATFSRLQEMGVPSHALNTAVTAIIAQRLVRRLCTTCKRDRTMTPEEQHSLKLNENHHFPVFEADGCSACNGTGYNGRYALFEILEVTETIRERVAENAGADALFNAAKHQGMTTLFEQGVAAVKQGETSLDELRRVVLETQ